MTMNRRVIVIGAGVSGLTCAAALLERGHAVEVWTRDPPRRTTSAVAAAFWYPYLVRPEDACLRWGGVSFRRFVGLLKVPGAGVSMRPARAIFDHPVEDPPWKDLVPTFRRADSLPAGYVDGYAFDLPVIEMPIYLDYLEALVAGMGGRMVDRDVRDVEEAFAAGDAVVNCAGLGARELVGDREVYAVRGQVVRVERGDLTEVLFDSYGPDGPTYIVPRGADCILGGTAEEGDEDLGIDPATTGRISDRCCELEPRLRGAAPLGAAVGLRPCRPTVRVEVERPRPGKVLVHNYGHGGAGVTLSWGCAGEVFALLEASA